MDACDAEVYLRRLGERLLDAPDPHDPRHRWALRGAAAALVSVGAISADRAWWVVDDYATAAHIRSGQAGFVHAGPPAHRGKAHSLAARQFRVIDQEIRVGEDRVLVRDLAITADGGSLQYRRFLDAPGSAAWLVRRRGTFAWNVTPPGIVDSVGHRPVVRLGAGGRNGKGHADGELELHGRISTDAAWLEIDGARVDLHGQTARWEVGIEALGDPSPVERFLWRRLAVAGLRSGETLDLEPMIEALLAAGALEEGPRRLADLRAVAARMPRRAFHRIRTMRAPTSGLAEPWGSLLDREGADDGPEWTRVLGAVAPSCDGVQFAANSMTSDRASFEVEFEVAPNVMAVGALDQLPVTWWARDDLENHYLGVPTLWGGCEDDRSQGTMRYWPALDPRARRLDLLMCVESHQAVISVSLPESPVTS